MFRMGKLSLYGSIFLLIAAVIVFVVTNAGLKGTLYGLGVLIVISPLIGVCIYLLKKLPDLVVRGIVLGIAVIFFSIFLRSWLFTFLLVAIAIADIVSRALCKDDRIEKLTSLAFIAVIFISSVWFSTYEPTIEQQVLQEVEEEIKTEDGVYNASIYHMNFSINCLIVIDDQDMTFAERQQLGEMCGKSVSDKVNPKRDIVGKSDRSIGYLYDYYSLHIDVLIREEDDRLRGVKYTDEENIHWLEENIYEDGI